MAFLSLGRHRLPLPLAYKPYRLSSPTPQFCRNRVPLSPLKPFKNIWSVHESFSLSQFAIPVLRFRPRISVGDAEECAHRELGDGGGILLGSEDLGDESEVFKKTLRLVECAMFASVAGLAYFLSNSLAIEVSLIWCYRPVVGLSMVILFLEFSFSGVFWFRWESCSLC